MKEYAELFMNYLWDVVKHAKNLYSVSGFILAILSQFYLRSFKVTAPLIFFSFLIGSFLSWKEISEKIPKGLRIYARRVAFGPRAFFADGRLESPLRFSILLDVVNPGSGPAMLNRIQLLDFNMGTGLLTEKPSSVDVKSPPLQILSLERTPYVVTGNDPKSLELEIKVELQEPDLDKLARRLPEFKGYSFKIQYSYRDAIGQSKVEEIPVSGSFEEFKKETLKYWKDKNLHQLVSSAYEGGLEPSR